MKINTTLRIESDAIQYYKEKYKTNHAGCVLAVESFPYLREESLKILEGKFTEEQLNHLKKSSPSKISSKDMASRRHWEAELGDYYESGVGSIEEHKIVNIISKIRELSPFERFILREMIVS
mgnify:CR=1 FL=1